MEVKNKLGNWRGRYLVLVDGMLLVFSSKALLPVLLGFSRFN